MTEEYWADSIFSIARYYGQININGKIYIIVNKQGATVFELSDPESKYFVGHGAAKAIPPGEPADLVLKEWIPIYKALGREKTFELVREGVSLEEALQLVPKKSIRYEAAIY